MAKAAATLVFCCGAKRSCTTGSLVTLQNLTRIWEIVRIYFDLRVSARPLVGVLVFLGG